MEQRHDINCTGLNPSGKYIPNWLVSCSRKLHWESIIQRRVSTNFTWLENFNFSPFTGCGRAIQLRTFRDDDPTATELMNEMVSSDINSGSEAEKGAISFNICSADAWYTLLFLHSIKFPFNNSSEGKFLWHPVAVDILVDPQKNVFPEHRFYWPRNKSPKFLWDTLTL